MGLLATGAVVAGYRIDSMVGRGGMGVVYRATQPELDRAVALKAIAPELVADEGVRRRFLQEARAAARVDHPNVIPVHAAGVQEGIAYIVMRFVEGSDLRTLVRRVGALDPNRAGELLAQAGAALDAIHRAGFVHRDVKPSNLLVTPEDHVYVTDFGLAKQVIGSSGATRSGQWVGTLDYVAPEQIRGGRIDARADVYALGGVLHFMLTGQVPFDCEGDEAKLWAQLSLPPPRPSALRPGLPAELDAIVARAMAKDAGDRFPSAGDLARAAKAAAVGAQPSQPERMVARGAAAPDTAPTETRITEVSTRTSVRVRSGRPRRGLLVGGAAILVAAAAVAAVLLVGAGGEAPDGAASTGTPTKATATPARASAPARVTKIIRHIGHRPSGAAFAGGDVWVTSSRDRRITRVDAAAARERAAQPRVGRAATSIVGQGHSVWVASPKARAVLRLDARSGAVRARVPVAGLPGLLAVSGNHLWVGTDARPGTPATLFHFDARNGRLLHAIPVPEGIAGLAAGDGRIWMARRDVARIVRIDPATAARREWVSLPAPVYSMKYADLRLWLTLRGENTVARVDVRNRRGMLTGSAGELPMQALEVDGHVFVSSRNNHTVVVLDPKTLLAVGKPLRVGLNPFALTAGAGSVWVTGLGDDTLTRIDYR